MPAAEPPLPPPIAPVPPHVARPRVSVMIPTYEPDATLRRTLESVLAQAPGPDEMEIVVVDDGSPPGFVEEQVAAVDRRGRVAILRHAGPLGLAGNWNTAIGLARGRLVHLLHQDDFVLPGFYARLLRGFDRRSDVGMAFCRSRIVDGTGRRIKTNSRLRWLAGVPAGWLLTIAERQRVQTPSVIVRRDVYESIGGFRPELCQTLDWEMWVRIASRHAVWYEPRALAAYRRHDGNESARLLSSGAVWPDVARAIAMNAWCLPEPVRDAGIAASSRWHAASALRSVERLVAAGANEQAIATLAQIPGLLALGGTWPPHRPALRRFSLLRDRVGHRCVAGDGAATVPLERCA